MKHEIKVQMFGTFRMEYDGKPLSGDRMHHSGQFTRMMQVLLHYSETGISRNKLEEYVVGERDVEAPHTALRVIVYKTKKKLKELGVDGGDWFILQNGMYYWTKDIEVIEDTRQFEEKYLAAGEIERQLALSETENTGDNAGDTAKQNLRKRERYMSRTTEEDEQLQLYLDACYLYKGDFLKNYAGELWVAEEAKRYRDIFHKCVERASELLRLKKDWTGLEKLGTFAAGVEPFNNWETLRMEAYVMTDRFDTATRFYSDTVDYYLREYGIFPATKLLELLDLQASKMNHTDDILENIQEKLQEDHDKSPGGYYCSYPVFRGLYQFARRRMDRMTNVVHLMLCTIVDEDGKIIADADQMGVLMELLNESIRSSIRQCDAYMQYSRCQYLILLVMTDQNNGELVENRINHSFIHSQKQKKRKCHVNCVFAEV